MKIAIASTIVPNVLRTGSEIATFALVQTLQDLGHDVTIYAYGRTLFPVQAAVRSVLLATIPITTAETAMVEKLRWAMRSLRSGLPISSEKYNYVSAARLGETILADGPDLVLADHINLYPFVRALSDRLPLGVVFHDIQAASYGMVADGAKRPWWRAIYRREARLNALLEQEAGERAAFSWFLSDSDAEMARDRFGNRRTHVVPLFYPFPDRPFPVSPKSYDIGLIGTWSWPPVAQGMQWFLDEVLPQLPGNITVAVAGTGSENLHSGRIRKLGSVPDARAFLASCHVSAVPAVAGTGLQIKTLELAATGMPAVSTPLGVRGLDRLPHTLRVAGSAADFAAALVALLAETRTGDQDRADRGQAWNAARRRAAMDIVQASLAALPTSSLSVEGGLSRAGDGRAYHTTPATAAGSPVTTRGEPGRQRPAAE